MILSYKHNLSLARNFFGFYELHRYLGTNSKGKTYLGSNANKKCRFCNKNESEVTFNKDAHTLPKLLGNIFGLSNFECDNCNEYFCDFEKNLAQYLGPIRTLASFMNPDKRNPNFEHKEGDLKIRRIGNDVGIAQYSNKIFLIDDKDSNTLRLKYNISYIPLNIYKLLIKIAFCLFSDLETSLFDNTRVFIMNNIFNDDNRARYNAKLFSYITPFEYFEYPTAYLFKKKTTYNNHPIPEFTLIIFFYQCVYQVFLPFNINDEWIFENEYLEHYRYPALMIEPNGSKSYYLLQDCSIIEPVDLSKCILTKEEGEIEISYKRKLIL